MKWKCAIAGTAIAMLFAPSMAQADSISAVENARAKERQGQYLTGQDREQLRRYGSNDDYGPGYGYGTYGYSDGDYHNNDDDDDYEPRDGYEPEYDTYSTYPY